MTNKSKRIIIFSRGFLPEISGSLVAIKEVCRRLPEFEWIAIPYLYDSRLPQEEMIGNIRVVRPRGFKITRVWRCLAKLHREKKIDGIYTTVLDPIQLAGVLFFELSSRSRVAHLTALQAHGLEYLKALRRPPIRRLKRVILFLKITFGKIWLKFHFKKISHVHAVSRDLANWARDCGYKDSISLIPNGVSIAKFSQNSGQKINKLRKQLGINNEKIIITVARLDKVKNLESLIRGFYIFQKETGQTVKLLIVGDGKEKENLYNLAKQLTIGQSVLFAGGVQSDQIPDYLGISSIFVLSSLSEGFPLAIIEAMAAGVPVIATPVGGIPELLANGENGLYCQVNSPSSIATAIKRLLEDDNLRKKLIDNGKKTAVNYDWDIIAKKMRLMFSQTL